MSLNDVNYDEELSLEVQSILANSSRQFYFIRRQRKVEFITNGTSLAFTPNLQLQPDTLAKMSEGLNHMLEYLYYNNPVGYETVGRWLTNKWFIIKQDLKMYIYGNIHTYAEERERLIDKHFVPDDTIIEYVCEYVARNSLNNAEDDNNVREVTLTNVDCNILHVMSVLIKMSFLSIIDMCSDDLKFEACVAKHVNYMVYRVISIAKNYFDFSHVDYDTDYVYNRLDSILDELYKIQWNKNILSFQRKFEEVGKDATSLSNINTVRLYVALRKYVPALADLKNPKYITKYTSKELQSKYWTIMDNYADFSLVNKTLTSYLQVTTKEICNNQNSKATIANVNIPDFLQDASDTSSIQKEHSMYHDKKKFIYERTADDAVALLKDVKKALVELDSLHDLNIEMMGRFSIGKEHTLNRFILNKVLLALTGDSRVFIDHLGVLSKVVLYLFYIRLTLHPELSFFHDIARCMTMSSTNSLLHTDEQVQSTLEEYNIVDLSIESVKEMANIYIFDKVNIRLSLEDIVDLYTFTSNPSRVRNLMFPDMYDIIDDESVNDTKYHYTEKEEAANNEVLNLLWN